MSLYKPATLDDGEVIARRQREQRRRAEEAGIPGKTQTYQTTEKLGESQVVTAGESIDITEGVISVVELSAGDIDNICTF